MRARHVMSYHLIKVPWFYWVCKIFTCRFNSIKIWLQYKTPLSVLLHCLDLLIGSPKFELKPAHIKYIPIWNLRPIILKNSILTRVGGCGFNKQNKTAMFSPDSNTTIKHNFVHRPCPHGSDQDETLSKQSYALWLYAGKGWGQSCRAKRPKLAKNCCYSSSEKGKTTEETYEG